MYNTLRKFFQACLSPVDRACNFLFGSKYNPLYQSGTIAIAMLAIMIVTGLILVFFYRIAFPYESMLAIQEGVWFTRWIRALHRYSSDAAVVAVVIHIWRMIAEGKTWGPRFLAWTSGVFLAIFMLVIGWTGFVLVWDFQGQRLAMAGAEMLNTIPLFHGTILHTFSGAAFIGQGFFFMNLFLHMSLPLGMIFGLWIHTMRLNQPVWLPAKRYFLAMTAVLTLVSILVPAPLATGPDLLQIGAEYPLNVFYGFLIPLISATSPLATFVGAVLVTLLFFSIPFWLRPRKEATPEKSSHNQAACTGCSQCYQDCPFEAISMVPRTVGEGSESVASVIEEYCVGCGICSASCSQMAIGPKHLKPKEHLRQIRELASTNPKATLLLVFCGSQESGKEFVARAQKRLPELASMEVTCTGTVHPGSLLFALRYFKGAFVFGCEPRACRNRTGQELLELRVHSTRSPAEPGELDPKKVKTAHGSRAEFDEVLEDLVGFAHSLKDDNKQATPTPEAKLGRYARSFVATAAILSGLVYLSGVNFSDKVAHSLLRVAIRMPVQVIEECRELSAEELSKIQAHMRNPQECKRTPIPYTAEVRIDDKVVHKQDIALTGARLDKPMNIENEFPLEPGTHRVHVRLSPVTPEPGKGTVFEIGFESKFEANRVELVHFHGPTKSLQRFLKTN